MMKIDEYLTISKAAKFIGVDAETLRNWERHKKIKVYRHPYNGYRLFKKEDLKEVLSTINNSLKEVIQEVEEKLKEME